MPFPACSSAIIFFIYVFFPPTLRRISESFLCVREQDLNVAHGRAMLLHPREGSRMLPSFATCNFTPAIERCATLHSRNSVACVGVPGTGKPTAARIMVSCSAKRGNGAICSAEALSVEGSALLQPEARVRGGSSGNRKGGGNSGAPNEENSRVCVRVHGNPRRASARAPRTNLTYRIQSDSHMRIVGSPAAHHSTHAARH